MLHRDLKPANILVHIPSLKKTSKEFDYDAYVKSLNFAGSPEDDDDGAPLTEIVVKIADLGESRNLNYGEMATTFAGSSLYMAPEILLGRSHNHAADVWGIGCVFYYLLTGLSPFMALSEGQLRKKLRHGTYYFPKTVKLSCEGLTFLGKCLLFEF